MLYVYEFEVFKSEHFFIAVPFDFLGATQGEDERDIAKMAADWLKLEIEHRLIGNREIPESSFGNKPQKGGYLMVVAIEAGIDTINAVPAHEAAEILGVSRGRVSQMISMQYLMSFKKGRDVYVTIDSINARLQESPKAGRPKAGDPKAGSMTKAIT